MASRAGGSGTTTSERYMTAFAASLKSCSAQVHVCGSCAAASLFVKRTVACAQRLKAWDGQIRPGRRVAVALRLDVLLLAALAAAARGAYSLLSPHTHTGASVRNVRHPQAPRGELV